MSAKAKISVLDLSLPDSLDKSDAAQHFNEATRECGFIYIKYNADKGSIVNAIRREQRLFFEQSNVAKGTISIDKNNRGYLGQGQALMAGAKRADQKEVFFWGREADDNDPEYIAGVPLCGPNQWPAELIEFRSVVADYSRFIQNTGSLLLEIIALALGREAHFFKPYYERTMLRGQLLRYPPTENHPDQFGVAPHSDFGCITLLLQETKGLEVQFPGGQWVEAPPMENTLVVNIGDLLERWSNHRLPSTKHRVRNKGTEARYSIAMFYDPSPLAIVDPSDLLPDETPKFEPVGAADYILSRNQKSFAHYK